MDATLDPIPVMTVKAPGGTKGAKQAFESLESKLPSHRGRRFYGIYNPLTREYRACVALIPGEKAENMGLESWTIPGGRFVKRKVSDWTSNVQLIPQILDEMASGRIVDPKRPSVEFYRSESELILYLPVQG
jgi:hypothetical protein